MVVVAAEAAAAAVGWGEMGLKGLWALDTEEEARRDDVADGSREGRVKRQLHPPTYTHPPH